MRDLCVFCHPSVMSLFIAAPYTLLSHFLLRFIICSVHAPVPEDVRASLLYLFFQTRLRLSDCKSSNLPLDSHIENLPDVPASSGLRGGVLLFGIDNPRSLQKEHCLARDALLTVALLSLLSIGLPGINSSIYVTTQLQPVTIKSNGSYIRSRPDDYNPGQ